MDKDYEERKRKFSMFFNEIELHDIVKIGNTVEIKHYLISDFVAATVVDINEDTLRIKFPEVFFDLNLFPNDPIVLTLNDSLSGYLFSGQISVIESINPSELLVKINSLDTFQNLRQCERFHVSLSSEISSLINNRKVFAIVKNLNLKGFKIISKENILNEEMDSITVTIDKQNKFKCKTKIARKNKNNDLYVYGLAIKEISNVDLSILKEYINKLKEASSL